jgi:hypothetical protein
MAADFSDHPLGGLGGDRFAGDRTAVVADFRGTIRQSSTEQVA